MMRRLFALVIASFLLIGGQTAQAISVGPAIIDVQANPGSTQDFSFTVTNEEQESLSYAITIQKFIPQGEEGRTQFLPESDTNGLPDWMFVDAGSLTLRPGESRRVAVSLRVPNDATPGGHYAAIFLTQTNLDTAAGQNVSAIPRIGVLVFATISGSLNERVVLRESSVDQSVYSALPVRFRLAIENQGNVHVQPSVSVEVKNMFGNTVAKIDGNPDASRILPGSSRRFVFDWQKVPPQEKDGFWAATKNEWNNFAIGFYEAHVTVTTEHVGISGESILRFQVWPWHMGLLGLGVFVLIVLVIGFVRRRRA